MMEALAAMSVWKLIALGIFGIFALILLMVLILGAAAILGPGMRAVHGIASFLPKHEHRRTTPPTHVLGAGIVFLAVGLGIVLALALLPTIGGWGMFGVLMLSIGVGLIGFYAVASKAEREQQNAAPSEETVEPSEAKRD